jgi:hypothetical protein
VKKIVTMATLSTLVILSMSPQAYSKKLKRSDFTKAQQEAIYKRALASCRKQYGDRLHNVEVNYSKGYSTCYIY